MSATKPELPEPVAWLHDVVATDGEPDHALSFAPDNFPLQGVGGFRSIGCQPLYTQAAIDAAVADYAQALSSALGWPGGISDPVLDWPTLLRYVAEARAVPADWADQIEHRLLTWRQRTMNRSGDRLALNDFMGQDSIDDLIDCVCAPLDCGEAGHDGMSEDWKWPDAVARRYGHYVLAQTESAWKAWQAALSEQPAGRCYCDERGIGEPGVTCGDCPRDYGHRVAAHPAPVERVQLSEEDIRHCANVAHGRGPNTVDTLSDFSIAFARAVIAEHERANGIGTSAEVCRASQVGPDKWVCDCGGPPCIPSGIGNGGAV